MLKLLLSLVIFLTPVLAFSQKNLSLEEKMSDKYKVQLPSKTPNNTKTEGSTLKHSDKPSCNNTASNQMQALQKQRKRIVETLAQQQKDPNADPAYIRKCEKALVVTDKEILALKQKVEELKEQHPSKKQK
ncbi:MAG: hypothetical protein GY810_02805 [Aureispira sp.]|nr:hypothetical protein [Aureispira sp.]